MLIKWNKFDKSPPNDKELLVYYENGPLDKGYIIVVYNRSGTYRFERDKMYLMQKWVDISEIEDEVD